MSASLTQCAVTSMIIKSCYQPSFGRPDSLPWDYEKNTRYDGSGGVGRREGDDRATIIENERVEELMKCKGSQTDYRESESQTLPWEAPFKVAAHGSKKKPEILSLRTSTWGNGLPAGGHEVERIKRMRMKKAWLEVLPSMDTPGNVKICDAIISAIEANEWAFREAEIQSVMESQLELLEIMRENRVMAKEEIIGKRIESFVDRLGQQRDKKIVDIRGTFLREVRKLNRKHRGSSAATYKFHRSDIIARYANPNSHLYAPEMRFGFKSKASNEILDKTLLPEAFVQRESAVDDSSKWLSSDGGWNDVKSYRARGEDLCSRRTRWTDDKLEKLHADLKSIRINETKRGNKVGRNLLKRKFKLPALPMTPLLRKKMPDKGNNFERSCLFLQKITRGRAVQCMMFEGRDRCRELIEELKSAHSLKHPQEISHRNNEPNIFAQSREQRERFIKENRLDEIIDSLEGISVARLLDMLSKEETRLREERKAHAVAMLIERERTRREAEEAGRRQLERNRRRELDEMFRQIIKVNRDTVQAYLEDVINEEIETSAENEATQYVKEIADEIDASAFKYQQQESDTIRDREMIADMVHNFLLPEVNKRIMRQKMGDRQQAYLSEAHSMIYNEMKNFKAVNMVQGENYKEQVDNAEEEKTVDAEDFESVSSEKANLEEFGKEQSHHGGAEEMLDGETEARDENDKHSEENDSISEEDIDIYNEINKLT